MLGTGWSLVFLFFSLSVIGLIWAGEQVVLAVCSPMLASLCVLFLVDLLAWVGVGGGVIWAVMHQGLFWGSIITENLASFGVVWYFARGPGLQFFVEHASQMGLYSGHVIVAGWAFIQVVIQDHTSG